MVDSTETIVDSSVCTEYLRIEIEVREWRGGGVE